VQTAIRLLLERAGHIVFLASDGRKGLAIFEAEKISSCREWTGWK
jgi:hypothetical protein